MTDDEAEDYLKRLAKYHVVRYANERDADSLEIDAIILAEYAVDSMHEDDGLPDIVYDWISDENHWIWNIANKVARDFERNI